MEVREARYYQTLPTRRVLCTLCPHDCRIPEGSRGACAVRYNHGGKLYTLTYGKVVSRFLDPVEKKPLFHFFPGSGVYSIATAGCNLRCFFCQNGTSSQWPRDSLPRNIRGSPADKPIRPALANLEWAIPGVRVTPGEIVAAALASGARSIAYTYTEPTIFYELAYDTAVLARAKGLKNIFVTNGFIGAQALRELATVLDAVNIDLKFFQEQSYRRISRAPLRPILDAIRLYHEQGVWLEITTLIIPGINDSEEELTDIAHFVHSLGPEIPWHVSQFYPAYKMLERPITPRETLRRAAEIGRAAGLRYVYEGNVQGETGENTYCPHCRALLIERYGFHVHANRLRKDCCPDCGTRIDGVAMSPATERKDAQEEESNTLD